MWQLPIGVLKALAITASGIAGLAVVIFALTWIWVARGLPDPRGMLAAPLADCPDGTAVLRSDVTRLPRHVREAFVVAEQPDFWTASDFPLIAAVENGLRGEPQQPGFVGQLAALQIWQASPHPDRTLTAHLRQLVQADLIALSLSKPEILGGVLDRIYFGHAARGLACASAVYFGKQPQFLDVGEAALLAGLIKGPNNYDPGRHPAEAQERRAVVIGRLLAAGLISSATAEASRIQPLPALKSDRQK